jgi:hypothetical protein
MAHFAKLDINNVVIAVNAVNDNELLDDNGNESEEKGIAFLVEWSGGHAFWKQTSYTGRFRKNYAGIGFIYDTENDVFYPPQPFTSWTLNTTTWLRESPFPMPVDGKDYMWDEPTLSWVEVI